MPRKTVLAFTMILSLTPSAWAQGQLTGSESGTKLSAGILLGYSAGLSLQAYGLVADFAENFPLRARLGIGYVSMEPGDAWAARRIFINNNTNGYPEESGRTWEAKLDLQYPVRVLSLPRAYAYGGVRYARFTANFRFVGGNEDFDITSNHWGLGAGLENYFRMSRRIDLVLTAGLDYFFSSTLSGHDTSYSPEGEDANPREDYSYSDADAAVGQPKWEPILMFGFNYNF